MVDSISDFLIAEQVQNTLVMALRTAFASNVQYPWNIDDEVTSIGIYTSHPRVMPPYPGIVVSDPSIDNLPRTLNNDLIQEIYDPNGNGLCFRVFGGAVTLSSEIKVIGNTGPERRKILDYINTYLRFTYRDYLSDNRIDVTDVSSTGESFEVYGATLLHSNGIRVNMFATWQYVEQNIDLISDIELIDVNTILPDGSTVDGI